MDKEMKKRIASQLELRKPQRLFCRHDAEKPCRECMSYIRGNVSYILAVPKEAAKRKKE